MTVKDIIMMTSKLLQKSDIVEFLDGAEANNQTQKDCEQLLDCYNSVICELSEEYLPLRSVQTFYATNGIINFSDFTKTPLQIVACYINSQQIEFKQSPTTLIVPLGNVTVVYEYLPQPLTINEQNAYNDTKISGRIISLGVARDYLLNIGLYSEAAVFDSRFRQALSSVMLSKKSRKLRARGWF